MEAIRCAADLARDMRWLKVSARQVDRLAGYSRGRVAKLLSGRRGLTDRDRVRLSDVLDGVMRCRQMASPVRFRVTAMTCIQMAFERIRVCCPGLDTILLAEVRSVAYVGGHFHAPDPVPTAEVGMGRSVTTFTGANWRDVAADVEAWYATLPGAKLKTNGGKP